MSQPSEGPDHRLTEISVRLKQTTWQMGRSQASVARFPPLLGEAKGSLLSLNCV